MEDEQKLRIEETLGGMRCPKDSPCYSAGFERIRKAQEPRAEGHLDCIADDPRQCSFSAPASQGRLCRCPLRIYLAENLEP